MQLLIATHIEPFKFINFDNSNAHWSKKQGTKHTLYFEFLLPNRIALKRIQLPCVAKIIRISPRVQDFDNYVYNCKCIRDFIADILIPGKAPGQADSDKRIEWRYEQEKGKPKQFAIRIEIYGNPS